MSALKKQWEDHKPLTNPKPRQRKFTAHKRVLILPCSYKRNGDRKIRKKDDENENEDETMEEDKNE